MKKDHEIIIRTRASDYPKLLQLKMDFGHAGLTLKDSKGVEKHFDFAAAMAHSRYRALATEQEISKSKRSLVLASFFPAVAAGIALSTVTDSFIVNSLVSGFIGATVGFLTAPIKAVKLEREGPADPAQEGTAYPRTDLHFRINVTQEQHDRLLDRLTAYDPETHRVGLNNCAHKVLGVLSDEGIIANGPGLYETPNKLRHQQMFPQ